jgi:phage-related protein
MNEELLIKIKAQVDDATKKLEQINKKLGDIGKESKQASKDMSESFKQATRAAMLQVEAVKQLASSMINLGKSSMEVQKEFSKLNAAFLAAGSSVEQAKQTYTDLYRFMGDTGAATEAAQSLAQLTTNEKNLNEWTKILQGTYATFGSTISTESLAEAINHTAQLGEVQGTLADALEWVGISVDAFNASLAQTTSLEEREALIRNTLNGLYMNAANIYEHNNQALLANAESQARLDMALAEAGAVILPLITALNNLAATLLTTLKPAFEVIVAVVVAFVQIIAAAIQWISSFFSIFKKGGSSASSAVNTTKAISSGIKAAGTSAKSASGGVGGLNKALDKAADSAKELKRQVMGFDELNIVRDETAIKTPEIDTGGVGGGGGGGIDMGDLGLGDLSNLDFNIPGIDEFQKKVDAIKERIESLVPLVLAVGAGLAAWKILDVLTNPAINIGKAFAEIAGKALIIGGALLTIKGYSDGWVNGVGWGELLTTLAGVAAVIAGLKLSFGSLAASIGTASAGIALIVLGVKDFIDNGMTLQNTILIIGGAIGIAVGLATGGLSIVISLIVAAVAAVGAFTAAILLQEPAIKSVDDAFASLEEAMANTAAAENAYINAIDGAEAALNRLKEAEEAAGISGEDLYKKVKDGTLTYKDMDDTQRALYKAYLDNEQAQQELAKATEEYEKAKKAETIASKEHQLALAKESGEYDKFKKSVIEAYNEGSLSADEARDLIEKSMSEMSDASQQTFMEDIPEDIKEGLNPHRYESAKTKIVKWFQGAVEDIKGFFKDLPSWFKEKFSDAWKKVEESWKNAGNWFKDTWNKVKNAFSETKNWFKSTFQDAWKNVQNVFSNWGTFFSGLWDKIKNTFSKLGTNIANAIGSAVKSGINGVISMIENTINSAINLINGAIGLINKIPGVSVSTISRISLPRLAKGGIVDSATIAMIGEAGKEAVLPLENNTQWMDKLAEKIASMNNNTTPTRIILKVGERELGMATIDSINKITKQTGGLQLQLV